MQNRQIASRSIGIFGVSLAYAVIRYNLFGNVSLEQLPSYILNKALAFSAAATLAVSAAGYARRNQLMLQSWAKVSLGFAMAHILLSVGLWSRDYFPKLFGPHRMNLAGELTLLFGVLAAWLYGFLGFFSRKPFFAGRWLAALMLGLHAMALGFPGWLKPGEWPGGLPPISLLCFLLALAAAILFVQRRKDASH